MVKNTLSFNIKYPRKTVVHPATLRCSQRPNAFMFKIISKKWCMVLYCFKLLPDLNVFLNKNKPFCYV